MFAIESHAPPVAEEPRTDSPPLTRRFLALFFLGCVLAVVPLWTVPLPPMVDLAQHAAQVSTWHRWNEGGFDYSQYFWINWHTPYLLTNSLAALLSTVVSVSVAFKIVTSIAILGIPIATLALLRESGGNPLWALAVIPAGYSFAFYMGFVAFAFAVPIALVFVLLAWRYSRSPTNRMAWSLFLFSQVLFLTHTIAFGWAGLTAALLVAAHAPSPMAALRRWWPLLAGLVLPLAWVLDTWFLQPMDSPLVLDSSGYGFSRLLQVFTFAVGLPIQDLSLLLGILFFALPFITGGRISRQKARWIPCLTALGCFFAAPSFFMGTAYIHQRFTMFLLPTLLFALDLRHADLSSDDAIQSRRRHGWLILSSALVWLAFVQVQFLGFRAEVGAFEDLLATMEPNRIVLYMPIDFNSGSIPYPVYLHFGCWYQVEKGGIVDYSFAELFANRFRYLPEAAPQLTTELRWRPAEFDWLRHGGERYDYFLVRSARDPSVVFARAGAPVVPIAKASGGWWLFTPISTHRHDTRRPR